MTLVQVGDSPQPRAPCHCDLQESLAQVRFWLIPLTFNRTSCGPWSLDPDLDAFQLVVGNGNNGFPRFHVTPGPSRPPERDQLVRYDGNGSAKVVNDGLNSAESMVFGQGACIQGACINAAVARSLASISGT